MGRRQQSEANRPLLYFSYRLKGSRDHALRLAEWLGERTKVEVFADVSIPPGSHWPSALQDGLDRSSALIVMIDPGWLHYQDEWGRRRIDNPEDWVHREVGHALSRSKKILPVLVDDARMPPKQALPEDLNALAEIQAARLRWDRFEEDAEDVLSWVESIFGEEDHPLSYAVEVAAGEASLRTRIDHLEISGFRCFDHLEIDFSGPSTLPGNWACIAGINGAGKSSVLQAISLLLMGPGLARELGGERLQGLRRKRASDTPDTGVLRGKVHHSGQDYYVELALSESGPTSSDNQFWRIVESLPTAGFGAGRNLSDAKDRWEGTSEMVLAHISLFDPMARLARAEVLLHDEQWPAKALFRELVEEVFGEDEMHVAGNGSTNRFTVAQTTVGALDLPDGFRSSAAWMADMCVRFSKAQPKAASLADLSGIVLIDEIDLHLHASLQRTIVPRLRAALPNVQFIVTSHSPLILSSFDRHELVLLDRHADGGKRKLDRQILGFSTNDIYDWLMDTPPHSAELDKKLGEGTDPDLAVLLYQSPAYSEAEARKRHETQKELLMEMGYEEGAEV